MFEVHRDLDARFRKFVIVNTLTGFYANNGKRAKRYFTIKGADKGIRRINRRLNKTIAKMS